MCRRALTRNIRKIAPPPEIAAKYLLFWAQGDLYTDPTRFPHLTSADIFGNDHPLELEVGCGTGEWLCAMAAANPDTNFIGVDNWTKVVYEAVKNAAETGVDNLKFIRAPFQFTHSRLAPESLHAVYMHYPDPNVRGRDGHKLFNQPFLDVIYPALIPGGRLHVVSDHTEFFEEMLTIVETDPRWQKTHTDRHLIGYEPAVKSRYQKLWEKHDVPPLRFEVKK